MLLAAVPRFRPMLSQLATWLFHQHTMKVLIFIFYNVWKIVKHNIE